MDVRVSAEKMDSVVQNLKVAGNFAFRQTGIKEPPLIKFLTQRLERRWEAPPDRLFHRFCGSGVCLKVTECILDASQEVFEYDGIPVDFVAVPK